MAAAKIPASVTHNVTQKADNREQIERGKKHNPLQVIDSQGVPQTAGEEIRTLDVQLGKLAFYH